MAMNDNEDLVDMEEDEEEKKEDDHRPSKFGSFGKKILLLGLGFIVIVFLMFLVAVVVYTQFRSDESIKVGDASKAKTFSEGAPANFNIKEFRIPLDPDPTEGDSITTYVVAKVVLAYPKDRVPLQQEISDRAFQITDKVQSIIAKKHYKDIHTTTKREKELKPELLNAVNEILQEGEILDIYFESFQLQRQ